MAYENGNGVEKDHENAFKYYKLAADQGYDVAQNNVAMAYENGEGVEKDLKKAFEYFKLAADQGLAEALANVGYSYEKGQGVKKDIKLAFAFHERAGAKGYLLSYNSIGWSYHQGLNIPRDFKKAHEYYIKAGRESYALDNLGSLYKNGLGVQTDFIKAIEYYKEAIEVDSENPFPYYHLGLMYLKGYGIERNIQKAIELYEISANKGNSKAALDLAEIYDIGIGVKRNIVKAEFWLKKTNEMPDEQEVGYLNLKAIKTYKIKEIQTQIKKVRQKSLNTNKFYALMIGVDQYDEYPKLATPINDIQVLGEVLKEKYNFKIINLINPTRKDITSRLSKLEKTLNKNDSLLIYFAGHGILKDGYGYWLPKNAELEDDSYWLANDYVTKKLKSIKANNILVIADSCYSGSLTRGITEFKEDKKFSVNTYLNTKSRMVISSGGIKPVLDGGGGGHSVFARMLINKLKNSNQHLISSELYSAISKKVTEASKVFNIEQIPMLSSLPMSGHEAPDFVFIPK